MNVSTKSHFFQECFSVWKNCCQCTYCRNGWEMSNFWAVCCPWGGTWPTWRISKITNYSSLMCYFKVCQVTVWGNATQTYYSCCITDKHQLTASTGQSEFFPECQFVSKNHLWVDYWYGTRYWKKTKGSGRNFFSLWLTIKQQILLIPPKYIFKRHFFVGLALSLMRMRNNSVLLAIIMYPSEKYPVFHKIYTGTSF